jgi:hypothetical protein
MAQGKRPDYRVLVSREVGGKTFYTEVGAAWRVNNGKSPSQLISFNFPSLDNENH